MKNCLFTKSSTESVLVSTSSFSHAEIDSATTVNLFFKCVEDGKDATVKITLSVTSGKGSDFIKSFSNQVQSSDATTTMVYDAVNSLYFTPDVTGISIIRTTIAPTITGADGTDGADGVGIPTGGSTGQFLSKASATDYDTEWSNVSTLRIEVRNTSGGTLLKGTPVYATGVTGNTPDVDASRADDSAKMPAKYVLDEDIANNAKGQAIISGVIEDIDTSSFSPGDVIYVGATGGFTNVKPTGTNLIQNLGVVTKSNANTGSGVVLGAGRANDVPNIPDGQVWIGNASGVATPTTLSTLHTSGTVSGKSHQVYSQSFLDDLSTQLHYLPFKDINEQTTIYQEEAAMVMPCDGRVVSCSVRVGSLTVSSGDITIGVHTIPTGSNHFGSSFWTEEETESLTYTIGDYYHTFHFVFSNAQHFEAGDLLALSISQSADLGGTTYYYVTTVIEYDFNNLLGSSSQEFELNP